VSAAIARWVVWLWLLGVTAARADLPPGSGVFEVEGAFAGAAVVMRVFTHVPAGGTGGKPVLFVMHGLQRDADRYRDEWRALSERYGFVLLVPEFTNAAFPRRESYNFGGIVDRESKPRPRSDWSFRFVRLVFDAYRARSGSTAATFDLFGHSAGAQFAHRYALFGADPALGRIVVANAGSYTMPSVERSFPWGLGGTGLERADIVRFLGLQATLLLGDADTDPEHKSLPRDAEARAQGPHRLARGEAFHAALAAAARDVGAPFTWRKHLVPGVGHDNAGMAEAAARLLYGTP
jgi:pimeloyl-ACP methyl ester carboxylesterase